jgi:hypothetical protein
MILPPLPLLAGPVAGRMILLVTGVARIDTLELVDNGEGSLTMCVGVPGNGT